MKTGLSRTDIEYAINPDGSQGYGWNFYPGCLHKPQGICPVPNCWAEQMSKRQKRDFHQPHLIPELLLAPLSVKKPSTVLVNFMGDMFGDWVNPDQRICWQDSPGTVWLGPERLFALDEDALVTGTLRELLFYVIERCLHQNQFLFLTKAPQNLKLWGKFPDNAWVGVSICNQKMFDKALIYLSDIDAKHKWLSFEPLLEEIIIKPIDLEDIGWVVIGAQSNPIKYPEVEWVENIVWTCLDAHIPFWLKKNLVKCLPPAPPFYVPPRTVPAKGKFRMGYRQELPWGELSKPPVPE